MQQSHPPLQQQQQQQQQQTPDLSATVNYYSFIPVVNPTSSRPTTVPIRSGSVE